MIQKKVITRTLSGVLVGGMLLTFGGFALAGNDKNTDTKGLNGKFVPFGKFMKHNRGMHKEGFKGLGQENFDLLVKEGIITKEKADEIKAFLQETMKQQQQQLVSDKLKALVEKGTLTQEQADKILTKLEAIHKEREALFEKTKEMTPQERHQYMVDNNGRLQNPIDELVKDGTITQEQAKSLGKVMFKHKDHKGGRR